MKKIRLIMSNNKSYSELKKKDGSHGGLNGGESTK